MGIPGLVEATLGAQLPEDQLQGLRALLDALAQQQLAELPQEAREAVLHGFMDADPGALAGLSGLRGLTFLLFYGLPDAQGRNPNWEAIGYPGPVSAPPSPEQAPKRIRLTIPTGDALELTADVVVVGSGAGGGVIAGELAGAAARRSSCWRPAATTTRPTSTSSSCGPTSTCTAAAGSPRRPTARSR